MIQIDMVMQRLKGVDMMLRDELIAFEQLSGEDASLKTIGRIGGFLDGYQKAMEKQQWIPCAERLPEEFKRVLCCTDKEEMFLAYVYIFDNGYTFDDEEGMMWEGDVVAWMPLPSPYREEATDG